jgi:spore germination cell wall hydrolase CwlJ-like protein
LTAYPIGMRETIIGTALGALGAAALLFATSCVPHVQREQTREVRAVEAAAPLLRKLALDVPDLTKPADLVVAAPAAAADAVAAPPPFAPAGDADDAQRALECLTTAIYHEARSQTEDGQRAVAQVVLNRVRDRAFPASVCGVVYQGSQRRTGCQFSFTCDGSLARRIEPNAWDRARSVAQAALSGEVYAPVGSATHYHADYVTPWWASSLAKIGAVGAHVFYRWPSALERALTFRQRYAGHEPGVAARVAHATASIASVETGEGGVTIHRGAEAPVAGASPAAAVATPRTVMAAGVRVHLNRPAAPAAQPWSGAYSIDEVAIGAESDPI